MSRWTKKHAACVRCGTTERKHRGQGRCTRCYPLDLADGEIARVKPSVLRRVRAGVVQYRCTVCELWKAESEFNRRETGAPYGTCKPCRRIKQRKYEASARAKKVRARAAERRRKAVHEANAKARQEDRSDPLLLTGDGAIRTVPATLLKPVIDLIAMDIPDDAPRQQTLADLCRVSTRLIYDVERGLRNLKLDSAEKILLAAGMTLDDIIGQPGEEGWSPYSRYCLRCGTSTKLHRAKGFCTTCYTSALHELKKYGEVRPPHQERWSFKHDSCRRCRTTERKHARRGLCHRCVSRCERMAARLGVTPMEYMDALGYTRDFETGAALRV